MILCEAPYWVTAPLCACVRVSAHVRVFMSASSRPCVHARVVFMPVHVHVPSACPPPCLWCLWLCSVFVPVCPLSPVSISVPGVLLARFSDPFLIFKLVTHRRIEVSPRDLIYTRCATAPLYTCIHVCVRASMSVPAYPQPLSRAPCLRGAPYSKTQGQQMENTLEIAIPKQKECLFFCLLNSILPL